MKHSIDYEGGINIICIIYRAVWDKAAKQIEKLTDLNIDNLLIFLFDVDPAQIEYAGEDVKMLSKFIIRNIPAKKRTPTIRWFLYKLNQSKNYKRN